MSRSAAAGEVVKHMVKLNRYMKDIDSIGVKSGIFWVKSLRYFKTRRV